jgi:hypothetical protein
MSEKTPETPNNAAAPEDSILGGRLDVPDDPKDIYLGEVSVFRPIITGDIFHGVPVPGSSEAEVEFDLTMIVAHPSAMRKGTALEARAQAAPVVQVSGVRRTVWTPDVFDVYPLPLLRDVSSANGFDVTHSPWAADLRLCGPVDTSLLDVRRRVACLSPQGILLLLQRLVHTDTRSAIRLDRLQEAFEAKLEEVEMLETWVEEIVSVQHLEDEAALAAVAVATREFDDLLESIAAEYGVRVGELLNDFSRRIAVTRRVADERDSRTSG